MLKVGATTTLDAMLPVPWSRAPIPPCPAAQAVASPELRNMGTIGGNICQKPRCPYFRFEYNEFPCLRKNPQGLCYALSGVNTTHSIFGATNGCVATCPSDIAPVLVAMKAKIVTNKKTWEAADFFRRQGEQINSLDADEIVTEIQVPTPGSRHQRAPTSNGLFRKAIDFPNVSVAVVATTTAVSCPPLHRAGAGAQPAQGGHGRPDLHHRQGHRCHHGSRGRRCGGDRSNRPAANQTPTHKYKIQIAKVPM